MVELNPHILSKLRQDFFKSPFFKKRILDEEYYAAIETKAQLIVDKYKEAANHLLEVCPQKDIEDVDIAYRLEPQLSGITDISQDVLKAPKFGGIPDMMNWFDFTYKHPEKKKEPIKRVISRTWPLCSCCHKPLRFLGQINMGEWAIALHLLTYETWGGTEEYDIYHQLSPLGSGNINNLGHTVRSCERWYYLLYCNCQNQDNPNSNAVVLTKNIFRPEPSSVPNLVLGNACLWSEEEYKKAVNDFMHEHDIHPETPREPVIPLQFIEDLKILFDLEGVIPDQVRNNTFKHSLFKRKGSYQLFGAPESQQNEARYMCTYGRDRYRLHRQAPVITWGDQEGKKTFQMYGCFRCIGQGGKVWGRVDSSYT